MKGRRWIDPDELFVVLLLLSVFAILVIAILR